MKWKHLVPIYVTMMLLMIGVYLVVNYNTVRQHEEVHKVIFEYYGCNNITMITSAFQGRTICHGPHNFSEAEETMHSFNEVVTYNNSSLVDIILFGVLMIVSSLFMIVSLFRPKPEEPPAPKPKE
jgi:hypothetical protein